MASKTIDKLEKIKNELKNPDAKIRQLAVKKLVNIRHPEVFALMVAASKDPDVYVRMYAASAIGTTDDPSAVPTLLVLLRDSDDMVRISAAKALRDCRQEMAIPRLIQVAQDENTKLRIAALTSLIEYHTPNAVDIFSNALRDLSEEIRAIGAEGLICLIDFIDIDKIISYIDDPDALVRQRIATLLGLSKKVKVKKTLEERLIIEDENNVLEAILESLNMLADNDSISIIIPFIYEKYEENIRILALKALIPLKNPSILEHLYNILEDESQDIQNAVLDVIDAIGNPSSIPILTQILDEDNADDEIIEHRNKIIEKLQLISEEQKTTEIVDQKPLSPEISQDPIDTLINKLGSDDSIERIKASRELTKCDPVPLSLLYLALMDSNPFKRAYAAETLGIIAKEESATELKKYLIDSDPTATAFINWAYHRCLKITSPPSAGKPHKKVNNYKKAFQHHYSHRNSSHHEKSK